MFDTATAVMPAGVPSLDDPAAYETVPDVPVLDEHVMEDAKKGLRVVVDATALAEIAANTNRRAREKNNPCPLIVGHTSDDPQAPERKVVGYAVDFVVRPFGPDPTRMAIYATFKVRSDHASVVQDFPRRSVELWWERREIDPIALLGGTTPERDLGDLGVGVLRFHRGGEVVLRYLMDAPIQEVTQMARCDAPAKKPDDAKKPDEKAKKMAAGEPPADDTDDAAPPPGAAKPAAPATPDASGGDMTSGDMTSDDPAVEKVFADARWVDSQKKLDDILDILQEMVSGGGVGGDLRPDDGGDLPPGGEGDDAGDEPPPPAAGGDAADAPLPPSKKSGPPSDEDRKSNEPGPVRLGASPGATGGYIPDAVGKKEPHKMSRTVDDAAALRRELADLKEQMAQEKRVAAATATINALADGSALNGERIRFSRNARNEIEEVEELAARMAVDEGLAADAEKLAPKYVERIKLNYQRERVAPADLRGPSPARYQRSDGSPEPEGPADAKEAELVAGLLSAAARSGEKITQAEATKRVRLSRAGAAGVA